MIHETRVIPTDGRKNVGAGHQVVDGQLGGPLGRRHAGRRDAELKPESADQRPAALGRGRHHRALHAGRRQHARLPDDGQRPEDLRRAVDDADADPARGQLRLLRVRLPRGQLRDEEPALGLARRREAPRRSGGARREDPQYQEPAGRGGRGAGRGAGAGGGAGRGQGRGNQWPVPVRCNAPSGRGIPPGCVAHRLHVPNMRALRALPAGRRAPESASHIDPDRPRALTPAVWRRRRPDVAAPVYAAKGARESEPPMAPSSDSRPSPQPHRSPEHHRAGAAAHQHVSGAGGPPGGLGGRRVRRMGQRGVDAAQRDCAQLPQRAD